MPDHLPLRSRLLLLLRSTTTWRSESQLCKAVCRRKTNAQVSHELDLMKGDGLVEYFDASCVRYSLTMAGRNAAARVAAGLKKGRKAA